tara:strand:+ start:254 stop:613 length:360 start_codon:yes stop_codon:yes gene_type:complete
MQQQGHPQTNNIILNQHNFTYIKNIFRELIENKVKTIILVGSGGNGKSYLMNMCSNQIQLNNYMVFEEINTNVSTIEFSLFLASLPDKKILHFHYNPLTRHNITLPPNSVTLDMNHIRF